MTHRVEGQPAWQSRYYQTVMLPFLALLSDGKVYHVKDLGKRLACEFKLTDDDNSLLKQFPEFLAFVGYKADVQSKSGKAVECVDVTDQSESRTPFEVLEGAYQQSRRGLADELLQTVRSATPAFFERRY